MSGEAANRWRELTYNLLGSRHPHARLLPNEVLVPSSVLIMRSKVFVAMAMATKGDYYPYSIVQIHVCT